MSEFHNQKGKREAAAVFSRLLRALVLIMVSRSRLMALMAFPFVS